MTQVEIDGAASTTSATPPDGFDERWAEWMARGRTRNVTTRRRMGWLSAMIVCGFVCWQIVGVLGG